VLPKLLAAFKGAYTFNGNGENGREERASHTAATLDLAKPRAGSAKERVDRNI